MAGRLLLVGGEVLAPSGDRFLGPVTVVCAGGTIAALEPDGTVRAEAGDVVVEIPGRFVVPGLIDAHFHVISRSAATVDDALVTLGAIEGAVSAREQLEAGVTAVRDAGCRHHGIHALCRAQAAGLLVGPRIFAAGRNPTGTRAPGHWRNVVVRGPEEMRRAVACELDAGARWVKFVLSHAPDPTDWSRVDRYLDEEEIRAGVEAAHERGARVGVHCEGVEVAAMAVACGVDVLDHAPLIDERTAAAMAAGGVAYVPTLWAFSGDAGVEAGALAPHAAAAMHRWRAEHQASVQRALAAGVCIAAGSDAAGTLPPGGVLRHELDALAAAGLSRAQVLAAATVNAAAALGEQGRLGVLARGAAADLVVLDADPLEALAALATPRLVVAAGRVVLDRVSVAAPSLVAPRALADTAAALADVVSRWSEVEAVPPRPAPTDRRPAGAAGAAHGAVDLDALVDALLAETGASRTTVRLCRADGVVELVAEALAPGVLSMYDGPQANVVAAPTYVYLAQTHRELVQSDCRSGEPAPPPSLIEHYRVFAQMLAPLVVDGALVGTISVHVQDRTRAWTTRDLAALVSARRHLEAALRA